MMNKRINRLHSTPLDVADPNVPNSIKREPVAPSIGKYVPAYRNEQLLADGDDNTYLAFPTTLKLSDEKVLIAYKATTAHKDVEADLDIIVYNPTTKQVVSKTTIDGTVGEAAQDPEPMQELEEICALPGIDMIFFGPADFSQGAGIPNQFDHPLIKETRKKIAYTARKHGKMAGTVGGIANQDELIGMGYQFINLGSDVRALAGYFSERVEKCSDKSSVDLTK